VLLEKNQVTVHYSAKINHDDGSREEFQETHSMTYFWPRMIIELGEKSGMELLATNESFSEKAPSDSTWSVMYLFRRE